MRAQITKRVLPVQLVVGPLHCKLNKSVRMQLRLFEGFFAECCEGITHDLQVLSLSIREQWAQTTSSVYLFKSLMVVSPKV